MAEQKLDVITRAAKLMEHTFVITSNRKRYPMKYIQLIKKIQNTSIDIYELLMDANRTNLFNAKDARIELQTKAITSCDKLSCFVEMSMNLNLVGSDTVCYWQQLISDVKYITISWREKDKKR